MLRYIGTKKLSMRKQLKALSINSLLDLHTHAKLLTQDKIRICAINRIRSLIAKRFGFARMPTPVLSLPYVDGIDLRALRKLVLNVMSSMPFSANIRAFIGRELRIVFRNRRSIAEMLQNHISFARSADARDWSCTCGHDVKDHICRRLSEVDPKVGALNSHDIPIPVRFTAHSNVAHGIASFVNDWQLSVDPPWLSTVLQKGKSTMTAPQVYEQIKDVCAAVPKVIAPGEGITVTTVERAKIQLTGMVISPLDKNNRAMFL
jgi:hypothetical protein